MREREREAERDRLRLRERERDRARLFDSAGFFAEERKGLDERLRLRLRLLLRRGLGLRLRLRERPLLRAGGDFGVSFFDSSTVSFFPNMAAILLTPALLPPFVLLLGRGLLS